MSTTEPIIRKIRADELPALMALYPYLHASEPLEPVTEELERHWQSICENPALHYVVAEVDGQLVATCTISIIPNLTRQMRPYGVIENVVTHPDFRRRGIATQVLHFALELAWERACYKVMLLTGRSDEATLEFYRQAGFRTGTKTAFEVRR